jgi:hypothetical protein
VVRPERKDVVSYFRDLLVHRLALRSTELYLSLLIDGELLAVMGFHMQDFHTRPDASVKQTFCFTPKHHRYRHIHKLALLAHTSSWFWQSLVDAGHIADIFGIPPGVQTTMFSMCPEVMTVRGIYKLKTREPDKTHGFKLSYYADMVDRSPEETVALWLKKWGKKDANA